MRSTPRRSLGSSARTAGSGTRIGDSIVMPFDAPPNWPPTPAFLRLYVEDADAAHHRAVAAGGTSVTEDTHVRPLIVEGVRTFLQACRTR